MARTPKKAKYRVKRFSSMKDALNREDSIFTRVHSVFEADVNANDAEEAIQIASRFFPESFGSTRSWTVSCLRWSTKPMETGNPESMFHRSDVSSLLLADGHWEPVKEERKTEAFYSGRGNFKRLGLVRRKKNLKEAK